MSTEQVRAQFPQGLPRDPWTGNPLEMLSTPAGSAVILSVLPGNQPNSRRPSTPAELIPYDPTNGINSNGALFWSSDSGN